MKETHSSQGWLTEGRVSVAEKEEEESCSLVVDIVVSLLRCATAGLAKKDAHFRKVLLLVEEVSPWLRLVYACLLLLPLIYVFCFSLFVCVCVPGIAT